MRKFKPKNFNPEIDPVRQYIPTPKQMARLYKEGYGEVSYIDHFPDGLEIEGTEDFSRQRWHDAEHLRFIWRKDERINKNGSPLWEQIAVVRSRSVKECTIIAIKLFGHGIKLTKAGPHDN